MKRITYFIFILIQSSGITYQGDWHALANAFLPAALLFESIEEERHVHPGETLASYTHTHSHENSGDGDQHEHPHNHESSLNFPILHGSTQFVQIKNPGNSSPIFTNLSEAVPRSLILESHFRPPIS